MLEDTRDILPGSIEADLAVEVDRHFSLCFFDSGKELFFFLEKMHEKARDFRDLV